jgi:hypothetical protein
MIKKKIVLLLLGGLLYLPFSASAQNDFPRHEVAVSLGYIPLYGMEENPIGRMSIRLWDYMRAISITRAPIIICRPSR